MKRPETRSARFKRLQAASEDASPTLTVARARDYLTDYPDESVAWMFLGIALVDLARYDEAEEALETAIRLAPQKARWSMLSEMGHLHRARGNFKQAAVWFRKVVAAAPEEATGYSFLGEVLYYHGKLGESEGAYRAAIDCPEGCMHEVYLNLGLVLRAEDRLTEASECFLHALKLNPDYEEAKDALKDVRATIAFARKKA